MRKFNLKDLLLIALTVAGVFSISYLLLPLMMMFPIFIYKPILVAPIYSVIVYMLIYNLRKPGVLTLFSVLLGLILFFLSPRMFLIPIFAGIITEIIILTFFRNYHNDKAILFSSALFPALQIPIALGIMVVVGGEVYKQAFANLHYVVLFTVISFFYGLVVIITFSRLLSKKLNC